MTTSDPSDTPAEALMDGDAGTQIRQTYDQLLSDAIKALTAAARLSWILRAPDGSENSGPCDWAEFVSLALAGATANMGRLEAILADRQGSWEADGVRNLVTGAVGYDEKQLLGHRTEPVVVNINVDDIMCALQVLQAYDEAGTALQRQYDDLEVSSWIGSSGTVPEDLSPVNSPLMPPTARRSRPTLRLKPRSSKGCASRCSSTLAAKWSRPTAPWVLGGVAGVGGSPTDC